ncbi:MAG: hypothetical protein LCH92_21985 [Proteobacteria bacterium]|nr:hypothetical protein [Pseudomonadota bacterium]
MEFFELFARAEYALKECGWLRNQNGAPTVEWWKYAERTNEAFGKLVNETPTLQNALQQLKENPPRVQRVVKSRLEWRSLNLAPDVSDTQKATDYLQTMRNNLFHGGKLGTAGWRNQERTLKLLAPALVVLENLIRADQDILAYVEGRR